MTEIKNKVKEVMSKLNMSHKITAFVLAVWFLSIITTYVLKYFGIDTSNILDIVDNSMSIVLLGYFGKATVENFKKIAESDRFGNPSNNYMDGE